MSDPSNIEKGDDVIEILLAATKLLELRTDASQFPEKVLPLLIRALRPDIAAYYTATASGRQLTASARHPDDFWRDPSVSTRFSTWEVGDFAIGKAIAQNRPRLIPDVKAAELRGEVAAFNSDIGTEIVVPVIVDGLTEAVIVLSRNVDRPYSESDLRLCSLFGNVLRNAYRQTRARGNRDARVELIKAAATLPTDDTDSVFATALELLAGFVPTSFASVWLHNHIDDTLVLRNFYPPFIGHTRITFEMIGHKVLQVDKCLSGSAVRSKQPSTFHNIGNDTLNANGAFAARYGLDWFISFPIIGDSQRVYGVVNIYPAIKSSGVSADDFEAITLLISQISQVVSVATLKRRQVISSSYRRICRAPSFTPDAIHSWNLLAAQIATDVGCEACSVFVLDSQTGELALLGTTGLIVAAEPHTVRYRIGEGLTEALVYHRDVEVGLRSTHISKFREQLKTADRSRSIIVVPILDPWRSTLGVIRCVNKNESATKHSGMFTHEDISVAHAIGETLSAFVL
jgi:hypothetical protein